MPTPALYSHGAQPAFSNNLPTELKRPEMPILYVTDRKPTNKTPQNWSYGIGRDRSFAVGEAIVGFQKNTSWEELATDATKSTRKAPYKMRIRSVDEKVRTPNYPLKYLNRHQHSSAAPAVKSEEAEAIADTKRLIQQRLKLSPKKELLIYVHGFATDFEKSLCTTAGLWHFMGREMVPITYTWPAGSGSLLRGYAYDRESSELTVFHFKRLLKWISDMPEVEGVHLIAHSRGADVTINTLRELALESLARGQNPQSRYKIRNVVLAAPDVSGEIGLEKLTDSGANRISRRWLTYTSGRDKAIGIAEYLFSSSRWGRIRWDRLSADDLEAIEFYSGFFGKEDATVEYRGRLGGSFGHEFHIANTIVSSDLVLALRFNKSPGPEHGRPLHQKGSLFWIIDENFYNQ
ncbi:alpha/beta hydrolase [Rubritalea tangerina]|uniref:Alpha/beta hydrolase n=2 Tax=Rubritalea tangerina TaxID=430798 RepID=A0ABW4ZCE2_9BACT